MGSWIGRQGQGAQAWTTYWFTPRSNMQFTYRHQKVSKQYIPHGGTLLTLALIPIFCFTHVSLSGSVQYEQWDFPLFPRRRRRM